METEANSRILGEAQESCRKRGERIFGGVSRSRISCFLKDILHTVQRICWLYKTSRQTLISFLKLWYWNQTSIYLLHFRDKNMSKVRHISCHYRWNSWQHRTSLFNWLCIDSLQSNKNPRETLIYNFKSTSIVSHLVILHIRGIFMYEWYILLCDVIIQSVRKHRPCYRKFPLTRFQIGHIVHILLKVKAACIQW